MHNDVYFQIGFLTTLGLTTKNAILIIQFARQRMAAGEGLIEATLGAARVRLRPVIMTSLAFFFGVLPLALATGAGAGAMKAIGTAVTGGMLSATFIDLFYIPLFFVLVSRMFKAKRPDSSRSRDRLLPRGSVMIETRSYSSLPLLCLAGCTMIPSIPDPRRPIPSDWPAGPAYDSAYQGESGAPAGPMARLLSRMTAAKGHRACPCQ